MEKSDSILYSQAALDFVKVSTAYCRFLEQLSPNARGREEFCRTMCSLLPWLYAKAVEMSEVPETGGWNSPFVTEGDYNDVLNRVAGVLGEWDDFLDVFVDDFKYSDTPVHCTISENLADTYQTLRELVETYRQGYEESMAVALRETLEDFPTGWGRKLLGALRAIHDVKSADTSFEEEP